MARCHLKRKAVTALAGVFSLLAAWVWPGMSEGQAPAITADGTLGTAVTTPDGVTFTIDGGAARGTNLFHSFGRFNVPTLGSATFVGPPDTANVISRVTGGTASTIDGLIDTRTSMPGASFFLVNPSGIMFTSGASLNVGGSFYASTANSLNLADGTVFSATPVPGEAALLTSAPPEAFGFLGPSAGTPIAPISVQGAFLSVDPGMTLGLVGGNVDVRADPITTVPAFLAAPSGMLKIGSVASAGTAVLTPAGLDLSTFSQLGQVTLSDFSVLSADAADFVSAPGTVVIRGGRLLMDSGSAMTAATFDGNATSVGIDVQVAESMVVQNSSAIVTSSFGAGAAADIIVNAGSVTVANAAAIRTESFGIADPVLGITAGPHGTVRIQTGRLVVDAGAVVSAETLDSIPTRVGVDIEATESVLVANDAAIRTVATVSGDAADIAISTGNLMVSSNGRIQSLNQGITGRAGGITVGNAQDVTITGGGAINTSAGAGSTGEVVVDARGTVTVSGPLSEIGTGTQNLNVDPTVIAGNVTVQAANVILSDGAKIRSGGFAEDPGARVSVTARDSLVISGLAGISNQAFAGSAGAIDVVASNVILNRGFITTSTLGVGDAGPISVTAQSVALSDGAQIASSTLGVSPGAASSISVNAGSLTISGTDAVADLASTVRNITLSGDSSSGLFSISETSGAAGDVHVTAGTLSMAGGGKISVATGPCPVCEPNTGRGGNINLRADTLSMTGGSSITASSAGTAEALAGNITITFGDALTMTQSRITTDSSLADGGNIAITSTGSMLHLQDSQITTSVQSGIGQGGNITVGTPGNPTEFLVLTEGGIHANAFGGPGGNINLFADVFLSSTPVETAVTASSALSTPGTVGIQAQVTDVSGALAQLPEGVLQAATLLRASCAARLARGNASTLVLAGREGVPPEPDGLLWSPLGDGPVHRSVSWNGDRVHDALPAFPRVTLTSKCER